MAAPGPTAAEPALVAQPGAGPPAHIAIIMDGNGRWAKARGLPRVAGHRAGAMAVRRTIEAVIREGISWLTLYAFSSENWARPAEEVFALTGLLRHYLRQEVAEMAREGIRLRFIGDLDRFEPDLRSEIQRAEDRTAGNTRLNLVIAMSYGARAEILAAARRAAQEVRAGRLAPEAIDETTFARLLFTAGIPDPDMVIRTSGEKRLSNFLLWQLAYAELVFLDVLWPDFSAEHVAAALTEFGRRERRFGVRPA
jgi:undecaprenyl diphosphate synthase